MKLEEEFFKLFEERATYRGGDELYFNFLTSLEFISECEKENFSIIGIDGFTKRDGEIYAHLDIILDNSDLLAKDWETSKEIHNKSALKFIKNIDVRSRNREIMIPYLGEHEVSYNKELVYSFVIISEKEFYQTPILNFFHSMAFLSECNKKNLAIIRIEASIQRDKYVYSLNNTISESIFNNLSSINDEIVNIWKEFKETNNKRAMEFLKETDTKSKNGELIIDYLVEDKIDRNEELVFNFYLISEEDWISNNIYELKCYYHDIRLISKGEYLE